MQIFWDYSQRLLTMLRTESHVWDLQLIKEQICILYTLFSPRKSIGQLYNAPRWHHSKHSRPRIILHVLVSPHSGIPPSISAHWLQPKPRHPQDNMFIRRNARVDSERKAHSFSESTQSPQHLHCERRSHLNSTLWHRTTRTQISEKPNRAGPDLGRTLPT